MLNVAVLAYACDPTSGSEGGVGWAWGLAAAEFASVDLYVRSDEYERLKQRLPPGTRITLRPVPVPTLRIRGRHWPGRRHCRFILWQCRILTARRRDTKLQYDLAHLVTYAANWFPPIALLRLCRNRYWGPVGGAGVVPIRCWRYLSPRQCFVEISRAIAAPWRVVSVALSRSFVTRVAAQNTDEAVLFHRFFGSRARVRNNIVLPDWHDASSADDAMSTPRRLVWAGRLVTWKGLGLVIHAMAHPALHAWRLSIVGDGPDRVWASRLVERLSLGKRIEFLGVLSREETLSAMSSASVLCHPSFREAAGWVVGEALALGIPVVCLDTGGPGDIIGENGIAMPVRTADLPAAIATSVRSAADVRVVRIDAAAAFSKDSLARWLQDWYSEVVG